MHDLKCSTVSTDGRVFAIFEYVFSGSPLMPTYYIVELCDDVVRLGFQCPPNGPKGKQAAEQWIKKGGDAIVAELQEKEKYLQQTKARQLPFSVGTRVDFRIHETSFVKQGVIVRRNDEGNGTICRDAVDGKAYDVKDDVGIIELASKASQSHGVTTYKPASGKAKRRASSRSVETTKPKDEGTKGVGEELADQVKEELKE